ncbi:MAG: MBOAT family protein [Lachnospiraceae bacterium]|nr:MBOAT family protein [Lachnospiraceae bacterium]
MVFSSFTFIAFFLPITIILYFICKNKVWKNCVLLVMSLIFYAWGEPRFVLMMILSIIVNYFTGLLMHRAEIQHKKGQKRLFMILGVGISIGFLFWFKYFSFLANTFISIFGIKTAAIPAQVLPIGISFYTFQILTYTIDVYKGRVPVQTSILKLALYISFFPQLIAGPIVNYTYIEPYLDERTVDIEAFFGGLFRFIIGLAKKVLIANLCGEILSTLTLTGNISTLAAWVGAISYTFQIYFDFSGYSDMAIGMGHMFGFTFLENFKYPYISTSITDFWRRWHISLSTFFRDYVYIPLGGNRCSKARQILNIFIVWMLTGFWHGASWNFIVWGLYYGVLLIIEKLFLGKILEKLPKIVRWLYTILIVIIGWVFFYHESLADGARQVGAMFGIGSASGADATAIYCAKHYLVLLIVAAIACVPWKNVIRKLTKRDTMFAGSTFITIERFVIATVLLVLCIVFLAGSSFNPFLYFRF